MATNHNSNHGGGEEVDNEKEGVEWGITHVNELIGGTERRSGAHYGILGQMDCGDVVVAVVVAHDVCVWTIQRTKRQANWPLIPPSAN